jgi:hypothetical protein
MARPLTRILFFATLLVLVLAGVFIAYNKVDRGQSVDDTTEAVRNTQWGDNVTITLGDGNFRYQSKSIPNHTLNAEYIMPDNFTPCVPQPTPDCSHIEPNASVFTMCVSAGFNPPSLTRKQESA